MPLGFSPSPMSYMKIFELEFKNSHLDWHCILINFSIKYTLLGVQVWVPISSLISHSMWINYKLSIKVTKLSTKQLQLTSNSKNCGKEFHFLWNNNDKVHVVVKDNRGEA
jgi:hypothetical protein